MSSLDLLVSKAVNNAIDKYMTVFLNIVSEKYSIDSDELHALFRQNGSFTTSGSSVTSNNSSTEYEKMTLKELRELCKSKNIKKVSMKRKGELVDLLNDFDQNSVNAVADNMSHTNSISDSESEDFPSETTDLNAQQLAPLEQMIDSFANSSNPDTNLPPVQNVTTEEPQQELQQQVQPESQPEVQQQVQPESQQEVQQQVQPESQQEVQQQVQPESQQEVQEVQEEVQQEVQEVQEEVQQEVQQEVQEVQEEVQQEVQQEVQENFVIPEENVETNELTRQNISTETVTDNYSKMNVDALKKLCKERLIKGIRGKNKKQLIELLSQPSGKQRCNSMIDLEEDARQIRTSVEGQDENIEQVTEEVNYYRLTMEELRNVCKIRGVDVRNKKKNDLIETLTQFERHEENFDNALIDDSDIF